MSKKLLINVQHHIYPSPERFKAKYNYSSSMYETIQAGSIYKMPFKEFIDLKTNLDKYRSAQAWYHALDPENKKNVERIIIPAPERINPKRCFEIK